MYSPGWYFNEWQSISIYATDLILLILFVFWAVDKRHRKSFIHKHDWFLLGFLAMAAVSVKNSSDFLVGVFLWLKLAEFALFYFYLKNYAARKFDFIKVLYALLLGGLFQASIAIGQFLRQSDLGLRWLGESVIGPNMQGVASFLVPSRVERFVDFGLPAGALAEAGGKIIRAYGTTPHPNVLAAYLFLAIFAFYFLILRYRRPYYLHSHIMIYGNVGYVLLLFGLFFTFSRTIIFLWGAGFLTVSLATLYQFRKNRRTNTDALIYGNIKVRRKRAVSLFLTTVAAVGVFSALYWPEVQSRMTLSSEDEAVQLRIFYSKESLEGGVNLVGIGLGDFTGWLMEQRPNLPRYLYQPVHNIYLLVYSEVGLVGFILFLIFLFLLIRKTFSKRTIGYWLLAIGILFIGLFDHFLLTLQQGRFVFWLGLTILAIGDTCILHSSKEVIDGKEKG